MGGAIGLDYCAVKIVSEVASIELTEACLGKLQRLEAWAIQYIQEDQGSSK